MFDTNFIRRNCNNQTNIIKPENHSASGMLVKSMIKSKFIKVKAGSPLESTIFDVKSPHMVIRERKKGFYSNDYYDVDKEIDIVVLQILLINDEKYLVEYITKDDFNEEELGLMRSEE